MPKAPTRLFGPALAFLLAAAAATRAEKPDPTPAKSAQAAYLWALGATAGPAVLGTLALATEESGLIVPGITFLVGGAVIGPSCGQFYAGSSLKGAAGAGIRGLGAGFVLYGLGRMVGNSMNGCDDEFSDCMADSRLPLAFGGLAYAVGLGYSLFQTWTAVHPAEPPPRSAFRLEPTLALDSRGLLSPGLQAQVRF